jgi:hypothetical protein
LILQTLRQTGLCIKKHGRIAPALHCDFYEIIQSTWAFRVDWQNVPGTIDNIIR